MGVWLHCWQGALKQKHPNDRTIKRRILRCFLVSPKVQASLDFVTLACPRLRQKTIDEQYLQY